MTTRGGFSVVELLVSIAVMVTLIGILLPTFALAREAARRVVCRSNLKQLGYGVSMYEGDRRELPRSRYSRKPWQNVTPSDLMVARVSDDLQTEYKTPPFQLDTDWDGVGLLFDEAYIQSVQVYYCPSHRGFHGMDQYADKWASGAQSALVMNYQYRFLQDRFLGRDSIPGRAVLLSDGAQTINDFNHKIGLNVLRADNSVAWQADDSEFMRSRLPLVGDEYHIRSNIYHQWRFLDTGQPLGEKERVDYSRDPFGIGS